VPFGFVLFSVGDFIGKVSFCLRLTCVCPSLCTNPIFCVVHAGMEGLLHRV
jgi:hypothetical protein